MRTTVTLALGLSLLASPLAGQQQAEDLTALLDTLAVLWTDGNATGLAAHGARSGIELEIHGKLMGSLEGRRAAAAFRQLFDAQETVAVEAGTARKVLGAEDRAFSEFIWLVRMPGAAVTEDHKIFMALVREGDAWRISEIRILR